MISSSSVLRRLPKTFSPQQVIVLDGIRIGAEIADHAYRRLHRMLVQVSAVGSMGDAHAAEIIEPAWTIADAIHRLHKLLARPHGLKRKNPRLQAFLRQTAVIEDLRNGIQHLDGEIPGLITNQLPVWGEVGWCYYPSRESATWHSLVLVPGAVRPGSHPLVVPIGKPVEPPVDHIHLRAFGHVADISLAWRLLRRLIQEIEAAIQQNADAKQHFGSDCLLITDFREVDDASTATVAARADVEWRVTLPNSEMPQS
jgi:hypothetical protein